ncbi:hypothetical protein ACXJY6_09070 [Vibrio sp. RC27]
MNRFLALILLIVFSSINQANSETTQEPFQLNINIQSREDGVSYIKASYILSQLNSCKISQQQKDSYLKIVSSINAQDYVLISKSEELSGLPCSALLSVFDNLIDVKDQIFERYPLDNDTHQDKMTNRNAPPITPKDDIAIWRLGFASVICAGVADVNPNAILGDSKLYFEDSIKLYAYFVDTNFNEAKLHQSGWYKMVTGEPAIKAQGLRSLTGAKRYVQKELIDTDAKECSDIHDSANFLLSKYGLKL